jgi:hypothetical protein
MDLFFAKTEIDSGYLHLLFQNLAGIEKDMSRISEINGSGKN